MNVLATLKPVLDVGVHKDIPDSVYFDLPYASKSGLCAKYLGESPPRDNAALRIGSAFDWLITKPAEAGRWVEFVDGVDRRSKEGREAWDELMESSGDRVLVREGGERNQLNQALDYAQKEWPRLLKAAEANPNHTQLVLVWDDPESGVRCKGKIDHSIPGKIIDYKTSSCLTPEDFVANIFYYHYQIQAAMYSDGWEALTGERSDWLWAVASKRPNLIGGGAWLIPIEDKPLAHGRKMYKALLMQEARSPQQ